MCEKCEKCRFQPAFVVHSTQRLVKIYNRWLFYYFKHFTKRSFCNFSEIRRAISHLRVGKTYQLLLRCIYRRAILKGDMALEKRKKHQLLLRCCQLLHQTFQRFWHKFQVLLFYEAMLPSLAIQHVDIVRGDELHQLHAPLERDRVVFNAVKYPAKFFNFRSKLGPSLNNQ